MDGEIKTWELGRCLREAFPSETSPVRANVEFFIKIRNKIEHRYEQLLATALAGKTQAHILNYEETLTAWFGVEEGLGKATHRKLPKKLNNFIREHDEALPSEVAEDWRYDFRVLLPQTGPKTESDAVMRFVREDEMTDEQRRARDIVQTIVRNKPIAVQNKGWHKPGTVAKRVSDRLGMKFSASAHHVAAWRHYEVRPDRHAARPELTNDRYCLWDEPHGDYLYSDAWVRKLIKDLADPKAFEEVTGKAPEPLPKTDAGATPVG